MTEHKFNNKSDNILYAVSLLLDQFQREDRVFAAQCIWWLASIIQFMEIVTYYQCYKLFPSDYVNNLVVTHSLKQETLIPESDIPKLDIHDSICQSDNGSRWSNPQWQPKKPSQLNTTRSGKVFKNTKSHYSNSEIQSGFRKHNVKQFNIISDLLRKGELQY